MELYLYCDSYYKMVRKRFSKWLMLPLAGNEPFQRFAIALGNSVLSKRCKGRVCAHREIHDVVTNDHGIQMSISVEILVRHRFTFDWVKTFNRGTLTFPTMSSLNSLSLSFLNFFPFFIDFSRSTTLNCTFFVESKGFDFNSPIKFSLHLSTVKEFHTNDLL